MISLQMIGTISFKMKDFALQKLKSHSASEVVLLDEKDREMWDTILSVEVATTSGKSEAADLSECQRTTSLSAHATST